MKTNRHRFFTVLLIIATVLLVFFVKNPNSFPFREGLDLAGGVQLLYTADTNTLATSTDLDASMSALRDTIERRVNGFGVSEPVVQVVRSGAFGAGDRQLLVELPGMTDVAKAIDMIGKTPSLMFALVYNVGTSTLNTGTSTASSSQFLVPTDLTGRLLDRANLEFNPNTGEPAISLQFNSEGEKLFADITKNNVGKPLAILLDQSVISAPVIREEITGGKAQITGRFTQTEAQTLVRNLNYGALPVPIKLQSTETIGPSLGASAVKAGLLAGEIGLALLAIFLILWYRFPGFIATCALVLYTSLSLALFKLIPVTLTAAGIAGFILSVGMAVDANILIFERLKEELKKGKDIREAMHEGFARAWLSIRDSNISSLITAFVLFWLGTSAVKGFALTLGLGVLVSMFTAITVSRTYLYALTPKKDGKVARFFFSNGLHIK